MHGQNHIKFKEIVLGVQDRYFYKSDKYITVLDSMVLVSEDTSQNTHL